MQIKYLSQLLNCFLLLFEQFQVVEFPVPHQLIRPLPLCSCWLYLYRQSTSLRGTACSVISIGVVILELILMNNGFVDFRMLVWSAGRR